MALVPSHLSSIQMSVLQWCWGLLRIHSLCSSLYFLNRNWKFREAACPFSWKNFILVHAIATALNLNTYTKEQGLFYNASASFFTSILFVFLSIHISALLFPDDGLIQGVKKDQRNCPNLQSFPLSSFPHSGATEICFLALIFFSILQILPFFFSFFNETGKNCKTNDSCVILLLPGGCLVSHHSIFRGRHLAISVIFIQADIERLLLLLHMTVLTSAELWPPITVQYVSMQTHLSSWKFFLPHPLP